MSNVASCAVIHIHTYLYDIYVYDTCDIYKESFMFHKSKGILLSTLGKLKNVLKENENVQISLVLIRDHSRSQKMIKLTFRKVEKVMGAGRFQKSGRKVFSVEKH